MLYVSNCVLHLILSWNIFPCRQENTFLHFTIVNKEYMYRNCSTKVKHIYTVLNCNL